MVRALTVGLRGQDAGYVHEGLERRPIPIRLELPVADKASIDQVLELEVRSAAGRLVPLSEVTRVEQVPWDGAIYHKDLLPVVFVTGDMAGRLDSPLYGMFDLVGQVGDGLPSGARPDQLFISAPDDPNRFAIKWDGEWQITYETFRDMGLAYSVGLVLIYLLIVAQFRSYLMPLIIMAPIPAHHHRRHAGARAARRPVHRHVHDRHDRAGRHHRPQFHPARGLHRRRDRAGASRWSRP